MHNVGFEFSQEDASLLSSDRAVVQPVERTWGFLPVYEQTPYVNALLDFISKAIEVPRSFTPTINAEHADFVPTLHKPISERSLCNNLPHRRLQVDRND